MPSPGVGAAVGWAPSDAPGVRVEAAAGRLPGLAPPSLLRCTTPATTEAATAVNPAIVAKAVVDNPPRTPVEPTVDATPAAAAPEEAMVDPGPLKAFSRSFMRAGSRLAGVTVSARAFNAARSCASSAWISSGRMLFMTVLA